MTGLKNAARELEKLNLKKKPLRNTVRELGKLDLKRKIELKGLREEVTDKELQDTFNYLNKTYLDNSLYVTRIRKVKFIADAVYQNQVSYGLFLYAQETPNSLDAEILLNSFVLQPWLLSDKPWLLEAVMFHEMCHGMLILNTHSVRHGNYTCEDHGPEFWELCHKYPKSKEAHKLLSLDSIGGAVLSTTIDETRELLRKHPNAKIKKKFLRNALPDPEFECMLPEEATQAKDRVEGIEAIIREIIKSC